MVSRGKARLLPMSRAVSEPSRSRARIGLARLEVFANGLEPVFIARLTNEPSSSLNPLASRSIYMYILGFSLCFHFPLSLRKRLEREPEGGESTSKPSPHSQAVTYPKVAGAGLQSHSPATSYCLQSHQI